MLTKKKENTQTYNSTKRKQNRRLPVLSVHICTQFIYFFSLFPHVGVENPLFDMHYNAGN